MFDLRDDLVVREKCIDFALKSGLINTKDIVESAQKFYWFITAKVNKDGDQT